MSIGKDTILTSITSVGMNLIGLLTGTLLARSLGPAGRGMMTVVLIWPQMLVWAGAFSLGYANIYIGAADPNVRRRLFANSFWVSLAVGSLLGIPAAFLLPRIVALDSHQHTLMSAGLLSLPLLFCADLSLALLQSTRRFDRVNIVRVAVPITTGMCLMGLWLLHALTLTAAIVATWAVGWASFALCLWFVRQDGYVGWRPDRMLLRRCFSYSSRVHLGTLANVASGRLDQLIMTALIAPKALGLYALAVTLSESLNQFASAVSLVLLPRVSGETHRKTQAALAVRSARWVLLIGGFGGIILHLLAPVLVGLIWGRDFLAAVPTLRVLLPGTVSLGFAGTLCTALRGAGKPMSGTIAELASLVVIVPLLLLLLPRSGILGAGLASTCAYTANALVAVFFFAQHFGKESLSSFRPTWDDWHDLLRLTRYAAKRCQLPVRATEYR